MMFYLSNCPRSGVSPFRILPVWLLVQSCTICPEAGKPFHWDPKSHQKEMAESKENQKNIKSKNFPPWRSPRCTHGGQITNRGVIAKKITTTPQEKWHLRACSRGEKVTSNATQMFGVGSLVNELFPCRKPEDEVIEHVWTGKGPEGFTILADLGVPPFKKRPYTSICHENLWCFKWVSSYPHGPIAPRFRTSVAAILVQKTGSGLQELGSKFPPDLAYLLQEPTNLGCSKSLNPKGYA